MKIQLAIDRVTTTRAKEIIEEAYPFIDIIEIGTSLIKEYGISSIREIKDLFPKKTILADLKTMDEGEYEFKMAYSSGADIATVMGAASVDTIKACYSVAENFSRLMMIDLLEVKYEEIYKFSEFKNAIFCIHTPHDKENNNITKLLNNFKDKIHDSVTVAVAGGIDYDDIPELKKFNIDIVIIGSAITRNGRIAENAKKFKEML
jgi:3-hexulose-6-phosphate synthase